MRIQLRGNLRLGLLVGAVALAGSAFADDPPVEVHVAVAGSDDASGDAGSPLKTPQRALRLVKEAGRVVLHEGTYAISRRLDLETKGVTICAATGESVTLEPEGAIPSIFQVTAADVTLEGLTLEGKFLEGVGGVRAKKTATKLTVRNCELRNFTRHIVDVDAEDVLIERCHIHHALWMRDGERVDAHGIVTTYAHRLRIRDCRVHNTSGDCFQAGRGAWQDIVIEGCDFWDGPLEKAWAGYPAGDYTAENAIDTKLDTKVERGRLTLKRCRFHGFRSKLIQNSAALNLKEHIDAVVDGCVVSDSEIGLRLRGTKNGGAWVAAVNTTIRDCDVGVRHEDNLENLRFVHNTIFNCKSMIVRAPSRSRIGNGWVIGNNLLLDISRFPDEIRSAGNQAIGSNLVELETLRPKRVDRLLGRPVKNALPPWYGAVVDTDQLGNPRSADRPVMGALEVSAASQQ